MTLVSSVPLSLTLEYPYIKGVSRDVRAASQTSRLYSPGTEECRK